MLFCYHVTGMWVPLDAFMFWGSPYLKESELSLWNVVQSAGILLSDTIDSVPQMVVGHLGVEHSSLFSIITFLLLLRREVHWLFQPVISWKVQFFRFIISNNKHLWSSGKKFCKPPLKLIVILRFKVSKNRICNVYPPFQPLLLFKMIETICNFGNILFLPTLDLIPH